MSFNQADQPRSQGLRTRVLLVNTDAKHFITHRLPQAKFLSKMGFDVQLAVPGPLPESPLLSVSDRQWLKNLQVYHFDLKRGGTRPWTEWKSLNQLRQIIIKSGAQIVHSATPKGCIYTGIACLGVKSVKGVVSTITGLGFVFSSESIKAKRLRPWVKRAYTYVLRQSRSRVIFQNPDDLALFVDLGIIDAGKTELLPGWGVDLERFVGVPENEASSRIVFTARMLKDKGSFDLIEAARRVKSLRPQASFQFVGDVDPANPASLCRADLEHWSKEGLIEWSGSLEDVRPALAAANIVCLPSWREGLPLSLLEGAAMQRALISTDVPGCRQVVKTGVNGILVPVRSPMFLAEAVIQLIDNVSLRKAMGLRARSIVEQEYSVQQMGQKVARIYEQILESA